MNRPTSLVLGPHLFSVEFVERIKSKKKRRVVGEAHRINNRILVDVNQSESNQQATLVHETVHQACWLSPLRFVEGWSQELEEAFIIAIEPHLLELFTRPENRSVRDYLTGETQ